MTTTTLRPSAPRPSSPPPGPRRRTRPRTTLLAWLLLVLLGLASAPLLFAHFSDGDVAIGTEAQRVEALQARLQPDTGSALVLTADPAALRSRVQGLPGVAGAADVGASADGGRTLVAVTFVEGLSDDARLATAERVETAAAGQPVLADDLADRDIEARIASDLPRAEAIGLGLALLVLVVALGWRAAAVPLATGLAAVVVALPLLLGVALLTPVMSHAANIVTMLGLGLGLDYGLLLLSRYRELRSVGEPHDSAVQLARERAGRTVVWSAATVAATLTALLAFRDGPFLAVSIGGVCATVAAVLAARTLAPALLQAWGTRMRPVRPRGREGAFGRLAGRVQARPGRVVLACCGLLLLLSLPAVGVRFVESDETMLPAGSATREAATAVAAAVPAYGQATVDVVAPSDAALAALLPGLEAVPGVTGVDRDGRTATLRVAGDAQGDAATAVVRTVRDRVPDGVLVGGDAALRLDHVHQLAGRLPLVVGTLCLLVGGLVLALTRDRRQAVVAVLLALLSQGATLGVLALVFGRSLVIYAPVIAAALAFALSVDYLVFLLHRARELRDAGAGEQQAVRAALGSTGQVITLAALIFSGVSIGFAGTSLLLTQQLGVALVVGVLLDATLVRCLLLPAALAWRPLARHRAVPAA